MLACISQRKRWFWCQESKWLICFRFFWINSRSGSPMNIFKFFHQLHAKVLSSANCKCEAARLLMKTSKTFFQWHDELKNLLSSWSKLKVFFFSAAFLSFFFSFVFLSFLQFLLERFCLSSRQKKKKKKVEKYKAHCARVTCEPNGEQKFFLYFGSRVAAATCNLWAIWSSGGPLPVRRAGVGFSSALWTWLPRGGESNPASHCTYLQNLISACQPRGGSRGSRGPPPPTLSPYMDAGVGGPGIKVLLTQRVVFRIRKFQNQTVCGKNGWKWGIFCGGGKGWVLGHLTHVCKLAPKLQCTYTQIYNSRFRSLHLYIYIYTSACPV